MIYWNLQTKGGGESSLTNLGTLTVRQAEQTIEAAGEQQEERDGQ